MTVRVFDCNYADWSKLIMDKFFLLNGLKVKILLVKNFYIYGNYLFILLIPAVVVLLISTKFEITSYTGMLAYTVHCGAEVIDNYCKYKRRHSFIGKGCNDML